MSVLAIIPARGGSKGIPHKNVIPVAGSPLLAWSIRQALAAQCVQRVIVSTDSQEIADVAEAEGADVFWRADNTATDTATTEAAVLEVLENLPLAERTHYTLLLQATSPIRQPHDLDNALGHLAVSGCDSLFAARRIEGYVWQHTLATGLVPLHGIRVPRQFRPEMVWEENGSFYLFRTESFLIHSTRHCGLQIVYEMDPLDSFQIDEYADVSRIERLIGLRLRDASYATTTH